MRIGILISEINQCSNWKLRIIQTILDDPTLELNLVIQDAKIKNQKENNPVSRLLLRFSLRRLLLSLQTCIEESIFFKEVYSVEKSILIQRLALIPKIQLGQNDENESDISRLETNEQLYQKTDLLINLGLDDHSFDGIQMPKYGMWSFLHSDASEKHISSTGFLEVLYKKSAIGFTLLKYIDNRHVQIIDTAFFNREWSMVGSAMASQEGGVSVLFKNLRRLQSGNTFNTDVALISAYEHPKLFQVLKYLVQFYRGLSQKIMQKIAFKLWGQRHECWSVFMGQGSFLETSLSDMKALSMPKDEFWADPFLFTHNEIDYVFFENYSYKTNRGKISCGTVNGDALIDIKDVLQLDYHMSFPFIFEENGAIFLMPETSENKRLEIYKAVDFPTKWEIYTTAFEGEMVADAFFFNDNQHQKWLFVNKQADETSPMNSELFIYKVDSVKLENLQPHAQNPVIIDARVARNGGEIFKYKNELYRPSQRNIDGIYGRALNINKIKKLTIEEYEEENIRVVEPDFDENIMAMHHLHQNDTHYVFDAAFEKKK